MFFPVDVGELRLATIFQVDGYVEGAGCRDGAADAGECYGGCLVVGDVGCGFRDKHECFFEAVEESFACFDGALDAVLLVVAIYRY